MLHLCAATTKDQHSRLLGASGGGGLVGMTERHFRLDQIAYTLLENLEFWEPALYLSK